jgi:hypothetical protein
MFSYPVAYCIFSYVANNKLQKQHRILVDKNEKLKKELETMKVILPTYYQVYSIIRSCYLWPARGVLNVGCQHALVYLAWVLKVVLTRISEMLAARCITMSNAISPTCWLRNNSSPELRL